MRSRAIIASLLSTWVCTAAALAAEPVLQFRDGVLTIRTERYEVEWREGCMVALRTFLPEPFECTLGAKRMRVDELPNGVGSFFGQESEARAQHHPWGTFPLTTTFPAQHPPSRNGTVGFEQIESGARLTYSGLDRDDSATLVQQLVVEKETGDLVIRQEGKSANPGVFGAAFSILNIKPEVSFIVPYFGGQWWRRDFRPGKITSLAWPAFWSVGIVVGQSPSGGVFAVWSDDPDMRPKFFRRYNGEKVQAINFEACSDAPWDSKTQVRAFPWRFNTFARSWIEPAKRYRDWLVKTHEMVPRKERASKWVEEIALIWPAWRDEEALQEMAQTFDPRKTLIMHWGWLEGFNRRIPEYIPKSKTFAEEVARAHRYGYRVGVYTSLALADVETHPTVMEDYGLTPFYRGLWREKPKDHKSWLVYVHPGSSRWREFYSSKMAEVVDRYGVDCLYQDVTGCAVGSAGLVEDMTFSAAVVACEKAIRAKLPRTALAGEYWDEVNACQEDFGVKCILAWGNEAHKEFLSRPDQPHPILSYLFHDYCAFWPHRGTIRSPLRFHQNHNIDEVLGALPVWNTTPDDRQSEARVVLDRAKLRAEGFRPYFPTEWGSEAAAYMADGKGRIVKYVRRGGSTFCYEQTKTGDQLRYARVTGARDAALAEPVSIDGWIAYGTKGPIGLDPDQWYCVFPGEPKALPVKLTRLLETACISGVRLTHDYCLISLDGKGAGDIEWQADPKYTMLYAATGPQDASAGKVHLSLPTHLILAAKPPIPVRVSEPLHLDLFQHHLVCSGRIVKAGNATRKGTFTLEDQRHEGVQVIAPAGGRGSEYSLDGFLLLPKAPNLRLRLHAGMHGGQGDGLHFVVRVNGAEIWRQYRETKRGWREVTIPLSPYAGRAVILSLALDCGKTDFHTSCDTAIWADARIVTGG